MAIEEESEEDDYSEGNFDEESEEELISDHGDLLN